jgi:formylglycine-generating enzyme required for sulfatase activity
MQKNGFVLINGGDFTMGLPKAEDTQNIASQHEVSLSSFYMSQYQVTQKEFTAIMGCLYGAAFAGRGCQLV